MDSCQDDIASSCDSEMRRPSTRDETVSTGDSSGNHHHRPFGEESKVYRLVYTEINPSPLYAIDHHGDDEMMRRYLQDTAQYQVDHDTGDVAGDMFEHFLVLGNSENHQDEPMDVHDDMSFSPGLYDNYVGHEVGVSRSPSKVRVLSIDGLTDFNSSDSFASTESIIPKNIECPKCPKKFMFKADLKRHDKHKHSGLTHSYFCKTCKKPFRTKDLLKHHREVHMRREKRLRLSQIRQGFHTSRTTTP